MIRVDGKGRFDLVYADVDDEAGEEEGWFHASEFEEAMSTHYGRMVHLDDRTIMFANPEDAAEYIARHLPPEVLKRRHEISRSARVVAAARPGGGGPFVVDRTRAATDDHLGGSAWPRNCASARRVAACCRPVSTSSPRP